METELKFEREKIEGIAVVGTYLIDAARRLGVDIISECGRLGLDDSTAVTIISGREFLSEPTKAEIEQLSEERRNNGERLACQAKIIAEGEIVILTKEPKSDEPEIDKNEVYREEFSELPLEKKIANLVKLEAMTLSETFSFILNSPQNIVGKVMDIMAEFGLKLENEANQAKTPKEHTAVEETGEVVENSVKTESESDENEDFESPIPAEYSSVEDNTTDIENKEDQPKAVD